MPQETSDLERRLSELQSQIDRLSMALHLWREGEDHLQPLESRLAQLTDRCAAIVSHWETTGERHAQAVVELEQRLTTWNAAEGAVVGASVNGFERAEARLAGIETGLHRRLTELSDQVQSALSEFRSHNGNHAASPAAASSWPLEGVVRLHNQLRESTGAASSPEPSLQLQARARLPEPASAVTDRPQTVESASESRIERREHTAVSSTLGRLAWGALVLAALAIGMAGVFLSREAGRQAQAATLAATQSANQQIAAARDEATQQIAEARREALKAQTIGNVLAAPDLLRFSLVGGNRFTSAQLLLSRSRGLVVSGSRLASAPAGSTYQVWLLTPEEAVSGGLIYPDSTGRFTLATDAPPLVPRPIGGASITMEPAGGSQFPTGQTVLSRAPQGDR